MAADRTLVDAAFKEATSRAGVNVPNLKPLYDSNIENMKSYLGIVTGAINAFKKDEEALKIGKDGQIKGFKNIVRKGYESLAAGETMPQKVLNALDEKIRGLLAEFEAVNTYGKGDNAENERARININARLQKVINQAVKNREFFTDLGLSIENWNHGEIDEDIIAPQQKMMDLANVDLDDDTKIYFNENDKLVYSTKNYYSDANSSWGDEVSYTLEQMAENVGQKNLAADNEIVRQNTMSQKKGRADGKNPDKEYSFNVELEKGEFLNMIKSDEDFKNIARRPIDGLTDLSFRDGLIDNLEISFDILDNMFYDDNGVKMNIGEAFKDLDLNNDSKITKEDFTTETVDSKNLSGEALEMFKTNKREFLDALTDIKHPAFNLDRSKSLIGDYYTGIKEQNYKLFFKEQRTKLPLKEGEAWEGSYKSLYTGYGNRALNYDVGIEMLNSLRKAKEGEATFFGLYNKTYSYDPKRKRWYGDGPELIRVGGGVTTTEIITAAGIVASEFKALMGGDLPGLDRVDPEKAKVEKEEVDIKVENSKDFAFNARPSKILETWKSRYKDMGFEFASSGTMGSTITITADNGEKLVTRVGSVKGSRNDQAKELNEFIEKNKI